MPGGAPFGNHNHLKHGMRHTRIYTIWKSMRQRCQNPNCSAYYKYGARGITVCDEWNDFTAFFKWAMEKGYSEELTIERVDVNGNYCPENCRWATLVEQANNRRETRYLKIGSEIKSFYEWSRCSGVKQYIISNRVQHGVPPELILNETLDTARFIKQPIACVETGQIYESISSAARAHNNNNWIRNVLDTDYTSCGFHWKTLPKNCRKVNWVLKEIDGKTTYITSSD